MLKKTSAFCNKGKEIQKGKERKIRATVGNAATLRLSVRGFKKGVSMRGGKSQLIIGVVRAPIAIINFASNRCRNL